MCIYIKLNNIIYLGTVMIATTMKRYLFMSVFSDDMFGVKLTKEEQK